MDQYAQDCMNKSQLVESMATKLNGDKRLADTALKAFLDTVEEALLAGEKVNIIGFGTFEVRERKARKGKNPQTGETIDIQASRTPALKIGKTFKNKFN